MPTHRQAFERRCRLIYGLLVVLLGATAVSANAQVVRGRLVEADEEIGIGGAMIALVDREGRGLEQVLTRGSGIFELKVPGPGEYRLRADRIGYAVTWSSYFRLASGDTLAIRMLTRVEAVSLEGIEAEADRRCRLRPEEGLAVTRVWDEARKALSAAAWTGENSMYRYEMLRIKRYLDRKGHKVESENRDYAQDLSDAPYVARPTDSLAAGGFARVSADESLYWAPDAGVLLSDSFLDTHCFKVEAGGDDAPGLVGLAFEPVSERDVPDIAGTMWLDPATAQLRRVEFRYVNLNIPEALLAAFPGGRVEFRALPDGTWIVTSWSIRMPRSGVAIHPLTERPAAVLDGIAVESGKVLRVRGSEGIVFEGGAGGRIAGSVFDTLQAGLPGARVFVRGRGTEVVTDTKGAFELAHLRPGVYTVHFTHPYLERFSYRPEPAEAEVREGAAAPERIDFFAPGLGQVIDDVCDGVKRPETPLIWEDKLAWRDGILMGHVTDEAGKPVAGTAVRVLSQAYEVTAFVDATTMGNGRLQEGRAGAAVKTNASGFYRACWVPVDIPLEVAVIEEDEEPGLGELGGAYNLSDLFPGRVRTVTISSGSPVETIDLRAGSIQQPVYEGQTPARR